jgi:hypothetical protein
MQLAPQEEEEEAAAPLQAAAAPPPPPPLRATLMQQLQWPVCACLSSALQTSQHA